MRGRIVITLMEFLGAMLDRDEAAIKGRDMQQPIHFVGCYYYDNTLDSGRWCDCDEDGDASRRYLAGVDAARARLRLYDAVEMADPATAATLRKIEALPYADHEDYRQEWAP